MLGETHSEGVEEEEKPKRWEEIQEHTVREIKAEEQAATNVECHRRAKRKSEQKALPLGNISTVCGEETVSLHLTTFTQGS